MFGEQLVLVVAVLIVYDGADVIMMGYDGMGWYSNAHAHESKMLGCVGNDEMFVCHATLDTFLASCPRAHAYMNA
jgi:hypothetical protein